MWFSFDPGGSGMEFHDTEEAARKEAEEAFEFYKGEAPDGWFEEVESVCWGEVRQRVTEKKRIEKPADAEIDEDGYDKDGNNWQQHDTIVEYNLEAP